MPRLRAGAPTWRTHLCPKHPFDASQALLVIVRRQGWRCDEQKPKRAEHASDLAEVQLLFRPP